MYTNQAILQQSFKASPPSLMLARSAPVLVRRMLLLLAASRLQTGGGADGTEADVGPGNGGIGVLGDDFGGDTGVLGAVTTSSAGLALLLRRVDGVEPEHVGVVLQDMSGSCKGD